jgi:hypothetical protein
MTGQEETDIERRMDRFREGIETDDVAQKRYTMYKLLDLIITEYTEKSIEEDLEPEKRLEKLKEVDGYMYKLSQDFLLSSSTMEKEQYLEKIIEKFQRTSKDE